MAGFIFGDEHLMKKNIKQIDAEREAEWQKEDKEPEPEINPDELEKQGLERLYNNSKGV